MKKLLFLLVFFTLSAQGQGSEPIAASYLNSFLSADGQNISVPSTFDSFLSKLEKRRSSLSEKEFVRYVFSKTHQKYLKKFEPSAPFNNLFINGSYNCLSGTILYAVILQHFDISYQVIETNYHIFLTVNTREGEVLLEATDPLGGYVDTEIEIAQQILAYKQHTLTASRSRLAYYQFSFDLYNTVSLEELRGLLYYNKAVDSFNHQKLEESIQYLVKANQLYSSSRTVEFSQILLLSLQQSKLDDRLKQQYTKSILSVRLESSAVVASLH